METELQGTTHSAVSHSADFPSSPPIVDSALEPRPSFLQRYPALTHFAVLAALLTPVAAVPYLLSKRHITALSRRLDKVSDANTALRKDMKHRTCIVESGVQEKGHSSTTTALHNELETSAIERAKQKRELSATITALRKEWETCAIEIATQKKDLSSTTTALRKELETFAVERAKRKQELTSTTSALRKELETSAMERTKLKEELNRISALSEVTRKEVSRLHHDIEQLRAEHKAFVKMTESVRQLVQDRKLTRQADSLNCVILHEALFIADAFIYYSERIVLLPLLGNSLADVAAFMYKTETHQSFTLSSNIGGRRSVERLRRLALELQIVRAQSQGNHSD